MSDVSVTLNNSTIAELDSTGIVRLLTSGTWMNGDILVQYEQPQSGPDASGLTAVPADVASGKKFIGVNGVSEIGTAPGVIYGSYTPSATSPTTFEVDVGTSIASRITCVAWWHSTGTPPTVSGMGTRYPVICGVMPCVNTRGTDNGFTIYLGVVALVSGAGYLYTSSLASSTYPYATGIDATNGKVRIGSYGSTYYFTANTENPVPYNYVVIYN